MGSELGLGLTSLFVVALVAAVTPVLVGLFGRLRIPQVVVLILGGVVVGPEVLDLANPESIELLANVGLGFLFLLAGYELDLAVFGQRAGKLAIVGWLVTVALSIGVVGLLAAAGLVHAFVPVALGLTTTALGTLLPILRDNNMLQGSFGPTYSPRGRSESSCPSWRSRSSSGRTAGSSGSSPWSRWESWPCC